MAGSSGWVYVIPIRPDQGREAQDRRLVTVGAPQPWCGTANIVSAEEAAGVNASVWLSFVAKS
jgi:hypothetical protein